MSGPPGPFVPLLIVPLEGPEPGIRGGRGDLAPVEAILTIDGQRVLGDTATGEWLASLQGLNEDHPLLSAGTSAEASGTGVAGGIPLRDLVGEDHPTGDPIVDLDGSHGYHSSIFGLMFDETGFFTCLALIFRTISIAQPCLM